MSTAIRNAILLLITAALSMMGCDKPDIYNTYETYNTYVVGDTGNNSSDGGNTATDSGTPDDSGDTGSDDTGWDMTPPFSPTVEDPTTLAVDVFGTDGNVYWFGVTRGEAALMNTNLWEGDWYGDIYSPNEESSGTYANLFVLTPSGESASYGEVETWLVGQSTAREWTPDSIPNIRVDTDEIQDDLEIDGVEHFRWNNGQVGSIFGEASALAAYAAIGYPVPRTAFALVGGSPWENPDLLVPMTLVEVYKKDFCKEHEDFFRGGCANMWETVGYDVTTEAVAGFADACQVSECDNTRLNEFAEVVSDAMGTDQFEEATEPYFDWEAFRTFQCMEWLLWVGDDYLHNWNNIVIAEGEDGLFRFLPYSTDISAGYAWGGAYSYTELYGYTAMPSGCQMDPECWQATISRCEELIDTLEGLNPEETIVSDLYSRLLSTSAPYGNDGGDGMLRNADDSAYAHYWSFYRSRWEDAREELEAYREGWVTTDCSDTGNADTGMGFAPPPGGGDCW